MTEGRVLAVWAALTVVLAALVLGRAESRAVSDPGEQAKRGEITGLAPLSLVREQRFAAALERIASRYPTGRLLRLRVAPARVDATVRTADYREHEVQVGPDLEIRESLGGESTDVGVRPGDVTAAAPERILREANRRSRTVPADVDYLVVTGVERTSAGRPAFDGWFLKLARGPRPDRRDFVAREDGTGVRGTWEPAS